MNVISRFGRRAMVIIGILACTGTWSMTATATVSAGKDYELLTPQPTSTPGKVEVSEFFSYGCSHCDALEPLLESWIKKAPKDVVVKRVPVAFSAAWTPLQKMYYALEGLGLLERLNAKVFDAMHRQNVRLTDESVQFDWVAAQGVDRKKYQDMYQSFAVQSAVARAQKLTRDYRIQGVPSLAVGGRYLTSASLTGSHQAALSVVDQLVIKAREDLNQK